MNTPSDTTWSCTTRSPDQTLALGRRLGALLGPGSVVALLGELGAGKTHLVKGVAEGLGIADSRDVTSPTFVLINEYEARLPIHHFDTYRLDGPEALEELGCAEYFDGPGVSLVEWADRAWDALPPERLEIELTHTGASERTITVRGRGPSYQHIIAQLAKAPA